MRVKSTRQLLIKSLFEVLTIEENLELELNLVWQEKLEREHIVMNKIKKSLHKVSYSPSSSVISSIMDYSRQSFVRSI